MTKVSPEAAMRRAIALSKRGFPAPNPHVGCVIVNQDFIVGEGFHECAGGPHAEVVALEMAQTRARGGEAFVTLEPCNHAGKTGPCSQALIQAGVKRVTFAIDDPNPKASGGSMALQQAGIEVVSGLLHHDARVANRRWLRAMELGRPFVAIKAASTLDGRIALATGESKWITDAQARLKGRKLRADLGAVLVGANTVVSDQPHLDARGLKAKNQPFKIILDYENCLTGNEAVFQSENCVRYVRKGAATFAFDHELKSNGDLFDFEDLLRDLWTRGCTGVLVEGGAKTISSFIQARLADELHVFWGSRLFGNGPSWFQNANTESITSTPSFRINEIRRAGSGFYVRLEPE